MQSLQLTASILVVQGQNSAILYHYFEPAVRSAIFGEHGGGAFFILIFYAANMNNHE